ncbi:MAG: bacillithiol biosynthesis deacetylase BshB1 [Candidatus Sumerlaeia bacterium]|nr:bacillithiol biosynthesis deacetylase BshB1 [Candidatus Sumerlaeia bacterium]
MTDALFIGAHPDDVEILAGGTVARMARTGRRVVIADATRGEMGTRGTPAERAVEAADAARILGVERVNLDLPDGRIAEDVPGAVRRVVETLRALRPRVVFVHEFGDHHPDHNALAQAVRFACFQSNVLKYDTGQERFRPSRLFHYVGSRQRWPNRPDFVVDITDVWSTKLEALRAHRSQLANPDYQGPETYVSSDLAWHMIEMRAGFFGGLINVRYAEGFTADAPLRIDDPMGLAEA